MIRLSYSATFSISSSFFAPKLLGRSILKTTFTAEGEDVGKTVYALGKLLITVSYETRHD